MESVLKVGRTITGGVSRAAGAIARGARRILASVPLLGLAADPVNDPHEKTPANEIFATGGEEAEVAVPVEEKCPAGEEKSAESSSPIVESTPETPAPVKEEEKTDVAAPASPTTPVEEKKVEPPTTPAPTPVPVEEKKEEIEKVEPVVPVVAEKVEQIVAEPEEEAPVENPAEISTTESVNEVQASHEAPPPVPAPVPILPPSEPAITEDVASVTKAIEENDISDKAVAAAVNEAIESANTNEIVNDSHHQNVINE